MAGHGDALQGLTKSPQAGLSDILPSEKNVRDAEREAAAVTDPEPKYTTAAIFSFCGQKESALRLLKSAIEQNYCSYSSLQSDPLLAKLRGTPEFSQLLAQSKECQGRYLAKTNN